MFKTTNTYKVSIDTVMSEIFPNGLPVNSFINKGRCAIRATSQEMESKHRTTLLVVPNVSIILSKSTSERIFDRPDYIVYGEISYTEIKGMMRDERSGLKIMSTPEGMRRIMKAANEVGRLKEVFKEWFLLLDESHTFISELYRKDILAPFDYFWSFDKKSVLSATPYNFSDTRFSKLDNHEVKFEGTLGTITLVNAVSVNGTLNYLLNNVHEFPRNVHIFYNSVNEIRRAFLRSDLQDCNIFCADDKDKANMAKLGELEKFFVPEPHKDLYKKVNFYTCKYFEGWDLHDDQATMVLVSNCNKAHTKIGISSKGKQAIGRLRSKPNQIIHITNHEHQSSMVSLEEYRKEFTTDAIKMIADSNDHVLNSKFDKFKGDDRVKHFADVDPTTKLATINLYKLDQQINESASHEIYRNINFIKRDWEQAYFDVKLEYSDIRVPSKTEEDRKSKSTKLKEDYQELKQLRETQPTNISFTLGKGREQVIKERNLLAYQAFELLDEATVIKNNYNVKKTRDEIAQRSNTLAEIKLLKLCRSVFKIDTFYTNEFIRTKLNEFYKKLNIINPKTGKQRVAEPSDLGKEGRFKIEKVKRTVKGKPTWGYLIKSYTLGTKTLD